MSEWPTSVSRTKQTTLSAHDKITYSIDFIESLPVDLRGMYELSGLFSSLQFTGPYCEIIDTFLLDILRQLTCILNKIYVTSLIGANMSETLLTVYFRQSFNTSTHRELCMLLGAYRDNTSG